MMSSTFQSQVTPASNPHDYPGPGESGGRRQRHHCHPGDGCRTSAPPAPCKVSPQVFLIRSDADVKTARCEGRVMAESLGFSALDATLIATAISELARNVLVCGEGGEIGWYAQHSEPTALVISVRGDGPEIGGIGVALRAMDELSIASDVRAGTTVILKKYCSRGAPACLPPPANAPGLNNGPA
jgi:serine/threonine-protein kinase RsbT